MEPLNTDVCIVGGGPAGMVLSLLLARAGIDTTVLEKHNDFLRDFRGDTVHPSTMEVFHDLGLLDDFLKHPHEKAERISAIVSGKEVSIADFTHLPVHAKFIAFMPQWEFLDFVRKSASKHACFHLFMGTQATRLLYKEDTVCGVTASSAEGERTIHARLVIGADGRHSTIRAEAQLPLKDLGAPIDVLWMHVPRLPNDPDQPFGIFNQGRIFIMLNRNDYWQCAFIIPKGGLEEIKAEGLPSFRDSIKASAPFLDERVNTLTDWEQIKLLTVRVDRLTSWAREGLLCIGDAAHAMSPVGGVGINLAIQDAVATANLLISPLRQGTLSIADLNRVQTRRELPTKLVQAAQVQVHKRVLTRVLAKKAQLKVPLLVKLLSSVALLRRIPAHLIGIGVRPERPARCFRP